MNSRRSLYALQTLLGHHNISVTQRYAHLSNESLMAAAGCVGSLVPKISMKVLPVGNDLALAS